jgi:hypothetical protein
MDRNLGEFPKFLVFNSRTESIGNSFIFTFSLPLFALYRFQYLLFRGDHFEVSNDLVVVFLDEPGCLPPLIPHREWETVFYKPALPGVLVSAIRRTPPL